MQSLTQYMAEAKEFRWSNSPAPTGKFKSFHKRGWPMAHHVSSGHPAINISSDNDVAYHPKTVKEASHGPLTVQIAQYHHDPETIKQKGAWTWRSLKTKYNTLAEAKAAGETVLKKNPHFYPPKS